MKAPLPVSISVIIPTFNEKECLSKSIASVKCIPEVSEILIADGGSKDGTRALGRALGCRVFETQLGRGTQMRAAAKHAKGDVVWLLHADTIVPKSAGCAMLNAFSDANVVGGAFWKRFDKAGFWMRGSRFKCWFRLHFAGRLMGDQAIFVRRSVLEEVGGVPDLPIMEEFELCKCLRRKGRLVLANATIFTSGRRFRKLGILRAYGLMWKIMIGYYLGMPIKLLAKIYSDPKNEKRK